MFLDKNNTVYLTVSKMKKNPWYEFNKACAWLICRKL